ncbi:hypothetical protein GBAR_LOCUS3842 [Geodia barretti]|uniref:G-protein coupled receptors family 2 profile 2 domain-containing protein n=1 Tax=Geodia barretti TaxID=519541 RepID=A0AA35W1L1_GEOBA|nr:hypothetical protein GBAR_LOCUS3842 [Geodia barretti]
MTNYPPDRDGVILPLKICVGVTSCLSIVGGFLIVLTFCWRVCSKKRGDSPYHPGNQGRHSFKERMLSPGRIILVNLSLADILVGGTHLWGVVGGYERYYAMRNQNALNNGPNGSTDTACSIQGALAVYGTISSFLWTITLSFFVVGTLALPHPRRYGSVCAVLLYELICWGFPAVVVTVVAVRREFGLDVEADIAWCYILPRSKEQNLFISLFAYNLWSYLTILLLLAFFFVTLCYTCSGKGWDRGGVSERAPLVNQQPPQERKSDYFKLIFAALILVILRMWDAIYVSLSYHRNYDQDVEDSQWIVLLIFLAVRVHLITMQPKLLYRF